MDRYLFDYYKIPENSLACTKIDDCISGEPGFFRFGKDICFGRCLSGVASTVADSAQFDAANHVTCNGAVCLPFRFPEVIDNLRLERYRRKMSPGVESFAASERVRKLYYFVRPFLPVPVRRHLQRTYFSSWQNLSFPTWPVDLTVDTLHEELLKLWMRACGVHKLPFIWFWPYGAPQCLIMTHDVETSAGRDFTSNLMDLDESYGIRASFQVIPENRYHVSEDYVLEIKKRGFEFNIHDLNHDGHLYRERGEFLKRAMKINEYLRRYQTRGFRAGAMYRNADWYDAFEFSYDMSVPNVAHLEPKRGGCCTVMPFFIGNILELPLTTTQDYSLFYILNDYSIYLWKKQLGLIRKNHGMMSFIAHPDYLIVRKNRAVYQSLLDYLQRMVESERVWNPLPGEVDLWWRARSKMKLVLRENDWGIEGPDAERARVAYAVLENGQLYFEVEGSKA